MPRVVIIGGGAAGLQCARSLQSEYKISASDVVIVEAMPQLGGRMRQSSTFVPGHLVELGAEFVHGATTRLNKHAADFGWELDELFTWSQGDGGPSEEPAPDGGVGAYYLGKERKLLAYDSDDADFRHLNEIINSMWEIPEEVSRGDKRTLGQYLRDQKVSERMMGFAEAGYANTNGGTLDDLSFENVCACERSWVKNDGEGDFRMKCSYADLISALADPARHAARPKRLGNPGDRSVPMVEEPLNVRLGLAVTAIEWCGTTSSEGKVRLTVKPAAAAVAEAAVLEAEAEQGLGVAVGKQPYSSASPEPRAGPNAHGLRAAGHYSHAAEEVIEAEVVVVTVPIPLLRSRTLPVFSPPLPAARLEAAQRIGCGKAAKLLLLFKGDLPPWPTNMHGVVCADCPVPEFWFRTCKSATGGAPLHVATGFLQARFRDDAMARGEKATVALACGLIDDMFGLGAASGPAGSGPEAPASNAAKGGRAAGQAGEFVAEPPGEGHLRPSCLDALIKSELHDWGTEPFARLGYTHCPSVNGAHERDFRLLAAPLLVGSGGSSRVPNDFGAAALLFAGEGYVSSGANMNVHSALDAGARAAGEAAAILNARDHARGHRPTHAGHWPSILSRL